MACWAGGDLFGGYPRSGPWLAEIDRSHGWRWGFTDGDRNCDVLG
jgi:hypothetical protein